MRLAAYGAASTVVAFGVVLSAFNQRANFYSACVYLAQSNACLMVLTNLLILLSIVFGHGLQLLFYGPLRAIEVEQIYEKAWYAVTETCLAMTIFRDEFDVRFIIMFGVLLFVKCFSWIGSGRVEIMEQQPPERPVLFHIRLASSLLLLCIACGGMVWHAITAVLEKGKPNMMVMFAFEFAILLITSAGILSRYILGLVEKYILYKEAARRKEARAIERIMARQRRQAQLEENERRQAAGQEATEVDEETEEGDDDDDEELDVGGWEEKGTWVFYSELCTDFLKLLTYLSFFSIVLTWYGLPLHIIRDVYLTLRSFITRIRDFIRFRRATAHMNSRYPDATAEEVGAEGVCIICREEMRPWSEEGAPGNGVRATGTQDQRHRPKKLPCGHILHFACLRSWLERQQRCPTCRRPVLEENAAVNGNANGRAPDAAPANELPQQANLAFQAHWGFGGFQFGMGANMGELVGGMAGGPPNQGNPPQPAQPGQPAAEQPQPQAPLNNPPNQHNAAAAALLEQRILFNQQAIDRERAMQEAHQGPTEMGQQSQSNTGNIASEPVIGAASSAGASSTAGNGQAAPSFTPQFLPYPAFGAPILPHALSSGLPAGMVLPPGWFVVPLTVLGMGAPETPVTPRPSNANILSARRGTRTYQENMRNYHALRTPTAERSFEDVELGGSSSSRPSTLSRTVSAPPVAPTSSTIWSKNTSRLTPEQLTTLKPVEQESISAILSFLRHMYSKGQTVQVNTILHGLPESIRTEILNGWPSPQEAEQLRASTVVTANSLETAPAPETAAKAVAELLQGLERTSQLRVLLGLPSDFRASVIPYTSDPAILTSDVERSLEEPGILIPDLPEIPPLSSNADSAEIAQADRETREAVSRRIAALNDTALRMREAARSLEETAANSLFSTPTTRSFADHGDRLNLFGERSLFPLPAQEGVLRSLQQEVEDQERAFRARGVVEGLLNSGGPSGANKEEEIAPAPAEADGAGSQESTTPPTAEEKGKGVDRGE
ncbi:hypothetical protein FN846DRAFT_944168 [Sphaerosporella brunnea]|uniref:RING-type E3 ubiquitin transferase n=1 Tax=Sphaerosporella brunnea TaxID=1250544 RepID=A0A5J5F023_9PEZI|nr:hypothetical protein FN846DRAFT_944168 [Sphaerosporella brunnea]